MQNWVDEQILYFSASSGALGFSDFSGFSTGAVKASSATNSPIKAIARPTAPNTLVAVTKVNGARQPNIISAIPNSMLLIDFMAHFPFQNKKRCTGLKSETCANQIQTSNKIQTQRLLTHKSLNFLSEVHRKHTLYIC